MNRAKVHYSLKPHARTVVTHMRNFYISVNHVTMQDVLALDVAHRKNPLLTACTRFIFETNATVRSQIYANAGMRCFPLCTYGAFSYSLILLFLLFIMKNGARTKRCVTEIKKEHDILRNPLYQYIYSK